MAKVLLHFDHGHVYQKTTRVKNENGKVTQTSLPVFRGNPNAHADALIKRHGASQALGLIDSLQSMDPFWVQARRRVTQVLKKDSESKAG